MKEELTPMYYCVQEPAFQKSWLVAIQDDQVHLSQFCGELNVSFDH